jgi:hypothetical protein
MGYHSGAWEFEKSGLEIHKDLHQITNGKGVSALHLKGFDWRVSDGKDERFGARVVAKVLIHQ